MNSDKKKRLIIPVATLMVAIVMMAGVGYATIISSTFTVTENSTAGGELEVSVDGINTVTDKILNGAKIPYGVHSKDGAVVNYEIPIIIDKVLAEKKVIVKDRTDYGTNYSINGIIKSAKLQSLGILDKITVTFHEVGNDTIVTSATGDKELTMKIVFKTETAIKIDKTEDISNLSADDIEITITASR